MIAFFYEGVYYDGVYYHGVFYDSVFWRESEFILDKVANSSTQYLMVDCVVYILCVGFHVLTKSWFF